MPKVPVLERALRLLNYRLRGKRELEKSLRERGYGDEEIKGAVAQLEEIGLVNDARFAESLAQSRVSISRRGRHAIFFEMLKKGLDKDLIDETLAKVSETEELAAAESLLAGRARQWANLEPMVRKRRAFGLLQRRGFSVKIVRQLLDSF